MKCVPIVSIAIFTNNYFKPIQNNYEFIYFVQEVDGKVLRAYHERYNKGRCAMVDTE